MPDMERYSRNILIESIGQDGQNRLLSSKVLIAGAGGLGSTIIANLAAAGVGNIGIIDHDRVELSNLNRQFIHKFDSIGKNKVESAKKWINSFNPDVNVEVFRVMLEDGSYDDIFSRYELVIDCFDTYKSKFLLNKVAILNNKPLIHGGATEFFGQATTIIPGQTACLKCLFPDADREKPVAKGIISPAASTIASIQAMEAVKVLLDIGDTLANRLLTCNGLTMEFREVAIRRNPGCLVCSNLKT